eukprot:gene872-484_t
MSVSRLPSSHVCEPPSAPCSPRSPPRSAPSALRSPPLSAPSLRTQAYADLSTRRDHCIPTHAILRLQLSFEAYGQTVPTPATPAPFPVEHWERWSKQRETELAERLTTANKTDWETAVAAADVESLWRLWSTTAEQYCTERSGDALADKDARRAAGRSTINPPKPRYLAATQRKDADGAADLRQRQLLNLRGRLRELHTQLLRQKGSPPASRPYYTERLWARIRGQLGHPLLRHDGGLGPLRQASDIPQADAVAEAAEAAHRAVMTHAGQMRTAHVQRWKERMQNAAAHRPRDIFAWCAETQRQTVSSVLRPDGSVTANVAEMDDIVRTAWAPIFNKYPDGIPEPAWEPYHARFGDWRTSPPNNTPAGLGTWPVAMPGGSVTLIPKGVGGGPLQLRPITVTSAIYRLWAATRVRAVMEWQETWIAPGQRGFRVGSACDDVYYSAALRLEHALLNGLTIVGLGIDLEKCFDT